MLTSVRFLVMQNEDRWLQHIVYETIEILFLFMDHLNEMTCYCSHINLSNYNMFRV